MIILLKKAEKYSNQFEQLGAAESAVGEELLRLESLGEATANSVNRFPLSNQLLSAN